MNTSETASENVFVSRDYKRSRNAYVLQCAFEYFVSIFVSDAFLAKLLTSLGLSDALIGVIASLVSFSFLFQLLSILMMQHITNIKRTVIVCDTVSQLFFLGLYLLPFAPIPQSARGAAATALLLLAYFVKYLISSMYFRWANAFVDPHGRAVFSARKEVISLISGILFTLAAGAMMDRFEAAGNLRGSFLCIAVVMLVLNAANFICLFLIRNASAAETAQMRKPFGDALRHVISNRSFLCVVLMTSLWDVARYLTYGFLGTFKTRDLLITVGTVQIINMIANVGRIFLSGPFGRYSDRHSYAAGYRMAMLMAALAFGVNVFTTQKTWWMIAVFTLLFNSSLAGSNQNGMNILYHYVDPDYLIQAVAIKNSVAGLVGFGASLVGGRILAAVQENGNVVLGIPMYGQQLLSAISCLLALATAAYTYFRVEKLPHRSA